MSVSSEHSNDYNYSSSPSNQTHSAQNDFGDLNDNADYESEAQSTNNVVSPHGTKYWIPDVPEDAKPGLGTVYKSLCEAENMYIEYASNAGFGTRKSTTKMNNRNEIAVRYFLCNKAGAPRKEKRVDTLQGDVDVVKRRRSNISVTGCTAGVKFKLVSGTSSYILYEFTESHNHPLDSHVNDQFSRHRRKLTFEDKVLVHRASIMNIGPSVAHRLQASLKGGYDNLCVTENDYRNCRRDMNKVIGDKDAQMVVDMLTNRKLHAPNFSFEYMCDNNEIAGLFWADEISKFNYIEFGHVLSFDATFRTNKYRMVFVPFTGVDNHYRSVIFGAGLLKNETVASYVWLLNAFLKAHVKQPKLVLTDQDPSMKQAVPTVFTECHHRFCMWHIMNKLPTKVIGVNEVNTEIRRRLHKLVWNVNIGIKTFERRWNELISEFSLHENKWLDDMYQIRDKWIPSFFKHIPLSDLMKTTSRSESSNSMFRTVSCSGDSLVQFMLSFEAAMDKQRYHQRGYDHTDTTTKPKMETRLPIELHAASIYTRTIFWKIQKEIVKGLYSCSVKPTMSDEGPGVFIINHYAAKDKFVGEFKVKYNANEANIVCSCNLFGRLGYLCRHVFCVFNSLHIKQIPEKYILRRWKSNLMPHDLQQGGYRYGMEKDCSNPKAVKAMKAVEACIVRFRSSPETLDEYLNKINEITSEFKQIEPDEGDQNSNKESDFTQVTRLDVPTYADMSAPKGIRNKGCGTHKRLRGASEKAKEKARKNPNHCHVCSGVGHNSRTCPGPNTQVASSSKRQKK